MTYAEVIDHTWPPARRQRISGIVTRDGQGGGKRVSAATAPDTIDAGDLEAVIAGHGLDLFQVLEGQDRLDRLLAGLGFTVLDPVIIFAGPCPQVAGDGPAKVSAFSVWPRLAIQEEIWQQGGIGPARWAVMDRVTGPKTSLLARTQNQPSGAAFVALHDRIAMIHAVEVLPRHRRQGCAVNMMRAAATWGQQQGATEIAALTLRTNLPAQRLFASLGMRAVGQYHYRYRAPATED